VCRNPNSYAIRYSMSAFNDIISENTMQLYCVNSLVMALVPVTTALLNLYKVAKWSIVLNVTVVENGEWLYL
jgi:hypothetical protein